jgi:hypothetical protein
MSHSLDVDAPSTSGFPANAGVRDRFQAAWHAGERKTQSWSFSRCPISNHMER